MSEWTRGDKGGGEGRERQGGSEGKKWEARGGGSCPNRQAGKETRGRACSLPPPRSPRNWHGGEAHESASQAAGPIATPFLRNRHSNLVPLADGGKPGSQCHPCRAAPRAASPGTVGACQRQAGRWGQVPWLQGSAKSDSGGVDPRGLEGSGAGRAGGVAGGVCLDRKFRELRQGRLEGGAGGAGLVGRAKDGQRGAGSDGRERHRLRRGQVRSSKSGGGGEGAQEACFCFKSEFIGSTRVRAQRDGAIPLASVEGPPSGEAACRTGYGSNEADKRWVHLHKPDPAASVYVIQV